MAAPLDPVLREHLDQHHGVLSAQAASGLGLTANHLRALVTAGHLVRVARGAYVEARLLRGATPQTEHLVRTLAVVLSRRGTLAASHLSAALVHGLPVLRVEMGPIRVVHTSRQVATRRHDAFTVHPCPGREWLTHVGGVPVVVPALAVMGTAMASGLRSGLMAADAALRRDQTTSEELADWLPRLRHHPGVARARQVVELADRRAESPGESLLRWILLRLGHRVIPQFVIVDERGFVARVDFYLPDLRVVVEFDGRVKYEGHDGKDALAAEKARERRIGRQGYGVARVVWADLFQPARVEAEIRAAVPAGLAR